MEASYHIDYAKRAAVWSILALAFVGFVFYPSVLYPDVFVKGLYVRTLITISALGFVWLLLSGRARLLKPDALSLAVIGFLIISLVSMALSPGIFRSFWGDMQRMDGVFALFNYTALFFIARTLFRRKEWMRYFYFLAFSSPFIIFYSWVQYAAAKTKITFPLLFNPSINPGALFGNPAFLSFFLIFAAGFALVIISLSDDARSRKLAKGVIFLSLFNIIFVGVRGAVIGIYAGALVFLALSLLWGGAGVARRNLVIALAVLIALPFVLFAWGTWFGDTAPQLVRRLVNLPNEPSFVTRWLSLESSIKAWFSTPKTILLGWGPEHFGTGYNMYYNPEHGTYEDVWFDRAHNKLADVFVTTGIFGLAAYLALFWIAIRYLVRLARKGRSKLAIACCSLLAAYFVNNLTLFDMPQTYVNFFLLLAFIGSESVNDAVVSDSSAALTSPISNAPVCKFARLGAVFGAILLIFYTVAIPIWQSQRYLYFFITHKGDELVAEWESVFRPRNFIHYTLLDDIWRRMNERDSFRNPQFAPVTNRVIEEMEYVVRRDPSDAQMLLRLANVLTERAIGTDSLSDYKRGETYARRAIQLSPGRQESYYALAYNLQGQGRHAEALELMQKAVALNPKTKKAQYVLGINLALAGYLPLAVDKLEDVRRNGWFPGFQNKDAQNVLKIYNAAGRSDLLIELYKDFLAGGYLRDPAHYVFLLRALIKLRDKEQVIHWAKEYGKDFPEYSLEMKELIVLAERGEWDTLEKKTGTE